MIGIKTNKQAYERSHFLISRKAVLLETVTPKLQKQSQVTRPCPITASRAVNRSSSLCSTSGEPKSTCSLQSRGAAELESKHKAKPGRGNRAFLEITSSGFAYKGELG